MPPASISEKPAFGNLLKHWRAARQKSQLDLALEAGVSARHVSFIESGRANPSREMILLLGGTLNIPLREQNDLLRAAGYANHFSENGLSSPDLAPVRQAIELILTHQEPYPAVVMDRHWNLLQANEAASRFFGFLLGNAEPASPPNIVRLVFQDLRPWIANWESVAESLFDRMHREAVGGVPDETLRKLLLEVRGYPGVPAAWPRSRDKADAPVIALQFRKEDRAFDFFSAITTLGTPRDITAQEIRVECFYPANEATKHASKALAAGSKLR